MYEIHCCKNDVFEVFIKVIVVIERSMKLTFLNCLFLGNTYEKEDLKI